VELSSDTSQRTLQLLEAIARQLGILPELPREKPMATKSFTIGSGEDYGSIDLWEDDLDDTDVYDDEDDAEGLLQDESFDSSNATGHEIDGGESVTLNSITLKADSGAEHDGTAGTGAAINETGTSGFSTWAIRVDSAVDTTLEYIDIMHTKSSAGGHMGGVWLGTAASAKVLRNLLVHDLDGNCTGTAIANNATGTKIENCICYHSSSTATTSGWNSPGGFNHLHVNCVYYGFDAYGINQSSGTCNVKNTICMANGTADFNSLDTVTYCMSEDDTADDQGGTGNLVSKDPDDQFVSHDVAGSENFHLVDTNADAYDAGIGTTDSDVPATDIDGDARDSSTCDIGADEYDGGAAPITGAITEGAKSSDTINSILTALVSLAEGSASGDILQTIGVLKAAIAEGSAGSDTWTSDLATLAGISEGSKASDLLEVIGSLRSSLTEGAESGETWSSMLQGLASTEEGAISSDLFGGTLQGLAAVEEGAKSSDSWGAINAVVAAISDGSKSGESFVAELTALAILTEGAKSSDSYLAKMLGGVSASDGSLSGDALEAVATLKSQVSDGAVSGDTLVGVVVTGLISANISEGSISGDSFANIAQMVAALTEGSRSGDVFRTTGQLLTSVSDGSKASDLFTAIIVGLVGITRFMISYRRRRV